MEKIRSIFHKIEKNPFLLAVQQGVTMAIPAILCGSTALLLMTLPISAYQDLIHNSWQPYLTLLTIIHGCTLDIISLILLITISISLEKQYKLHTNGMLVFVNLIAYFIFAWDEKHPFTFTLFQSIHLFDVLLVILIATMLYRFVNKHNQRIMKHQGYGDDIFINAMYALVPIAIITLLFGCLHMLMNAVGISNLQALISSVMNQLFLALGTSLFSGVIFIFLLHSMWFFGIHGGNVLDNVARTYFVLQNGQIMSKTFLDTFVLFGGCGTIICLIVAIFIAEPRKVLRRFTGYAAIPAVFNMNELFLFGLPIVLNPIYVIPFIITPVVLTIVSYGAVFFNLVPIPISGVEWTTPFLISGYAATGSIAGSILQLVNLVIGTMIYLPFVKLSVRRSMSSQQAQVHQLQQLVIDHEADTHPIELMKLSGQANETIRFLLGEILHELHQDHITLHYQPQVNDHGHVLGVEALLRCYVKDIGYLYPPLVIALLRENGYLKRLRDQLVKQVFHDLKQLQDDGYHKLIVSLNLTAEQLADPGLVSFLSQEIKASGIDATSVGLELTEQAALDITQKNINQLMELRKLGVRIIMDDFGMGHSSLMYMLNNQFDCVKLDGSLIKQLGDEARSAKIIESIMQLSHSLHFDVVAEYVEYEYQQVQLAELGCHIYQGWLYSKALPIDELLVYLQEHK